MSLQRAKDILKEYFGYDSLREGQEKIIDNILQHRDTVGIMPTGAGKSICFQIPALMLDGITIVISPLISLMKDQVNSLTQVGIKAAYLNSSLTERQYFKVLENISQNMYKIIYIAPERLLANGFIELVSRLNVSMVTVDEAHCISQWGQDFRPSYMQVVDFINKLPEKPIVSAFTATATQIVKDDIVNILALENPYVLVTGFDRSNLFFEVQKPADKYKALASFLEDKKDESGVIYCSTRDTVEAVCEFLQDNGYSATRYHAGLSDKERKENQESFIFDNTKIIVATNAFGMGIDKSNVAFVVHFNMPKDMESYYQEAGRAGRDGSKAHCLLLFSAQDVRTNTYMIENSKDRSYENAEVERQLKIRDRERLKIMTNYCHTSECLRKFILEYFGDSLNENCNNCGNCLNKYETIDITIPAQKIISCVIKTKERFGVKMIVDILRGSKNKRILDMKLDKVSTYNIMTEAEQRVRDIINYLVINDYLYITNDEYPLLKISRLAGKFIKNKEKIAMKLPKYDKNMDFSPANSANKKKTTSKNKAIIAGEVDDELLLKLKALRLAIAREQAIPAFIVFSDSTLIDMCIKHPKTSSELLEVSGVGKQKLERYGKQFLDVLNNIVEFTYDEKPIASAENIEANNSQIKIFDEPVTISVISDQINVVFMPRGKKVTAVKLNNWLVEKGYLEVIEDGATKRKIATSLGEELGIETTIKKKLSGENYYSNLFNTNAQKFIVENIEKLDEI